MIRTPLIRSLLQLIALAAVSVCLALTTTTEASAFEGCGYYASECAQQCGSTVSYEGHWSYWDDEGCWNEQTQTWEGCDVWVNEWSWGNGVQEFECQDADPAGSICMCAY